MFRFDKNRWERREKRQPVIPMDTVRDEHLTLGSFKTHGVWLEGGWENRILTLDLFQSDLFHVYTILILYQKTSKFIILRYSCHLISYSKLLTHFQMNYQDLMNHVQNTETLMLKKYDAYKILILSIFLSDFVFYVWLLHCPSPFVWCHILQSSLSDYI